jgi:hypothetical protein
MSRNFAILWLVLAVMIILLLLMYEVISWQGGRGCPSRAGALPANTRKSHQITFCYID